MPGLERCGKFRPHRHSIPGRPTSSHLLYRLSYPAHAELHSDFKYMSGAGSDNSPGTKFSAVVNIHVAFRLTVLYKYFNKRRLTSSSDIKLRLGL
jgi:predicted solute-binding protein